MRNIEHPGPVHPARVQCLPAHAQSVQLQLPAGVPLLQGLAVGVYTRGAVSAVFSIKDVALNPLVFVMPALSSSPDHVAYFSQRYEAVGAAHIESGSITFGMSAGQPALHCHAIWVEADGRQRSGHVLGAESRTERALQIDGWLLGGAAFKVQPDPETNFSLLQATVDEPRGGGVEALVVRVRPNEDLCHALEKICADRGVRRARIRGGVGSLIGAVFNDGRIVEPFVTEVFIREGVIQPGFDGLPQAHVDVGLVDHTGAIAEGRLARGQNPVLITFELVIEVQDAAHSVRISS